MPKILFLFGCVALLAAGCGEPREETAARPPAGDAPTLAELQSLSLSGLAAFPDTVSLREGRWQGEPHDEEGASRPQVALVPDFRLTGDWDGDGREEAAVLLTESFGGSGDFLHLLTVARRDGRVVPTATAPLGDRVEVRDARADGGLLVLDVVQAGGADPMCCPGDLATRKWRLEGGELREFPAIVTGRLTPNAMRGRTWVLSHWDIDEPKASGVPVTLEYADGQFTGSSGCNRYTAAVQSGELPGDLTLGPMAGTLRACGGEETAVEDRYRTLLGSVRKYGFHAGRLALTYDRPGGFGLLQFRPADDGAGGDRDEF